MPSNSRVNENVAADIIDTSGLEDAIDKACLTIDTLRAEKAELLAALNDLIFAVEGQGSLRECLREAKLAIAKAEGR